MEAAQIVEPKAFDGIRIIDFTHVLSGPVASAQLAMQGAQVIKIEPREGEISRATPVSELWSARGMGPLWMAVNVNKRSSPWTFASHRRPISFVSWSRERMCCAKILGLG